MTEAMEYSNHAIATVIGIGGCGISMVQSWRSRMPEGVRCIAMDRDKRDFVKSSRFEQKIILSGIKSKASTVEYAESVRKELEASLQSHLLDLDQQLAENGSVILVAGLGGVIGTWGVQLLCNHLTAREKSVITMLTMPFGFERERIKVAEAALPGFDGAAHRVLCFNDYLIKHTPDGISMEDALNIMNDKAFEMIPFDA